MQAKFNRRSLLKSVFIIALPLMVLVITASASYKTPVNHYSTTADTTIHPTKFNFGRLATPAEIAAWDIDVNADGKGLPAGAGTAAAGKKLYIAKCAACHGVTGEEQPGITLPAPSLVSDTVFTGRKLNTIGNYWPYATTLFDYIYRAMPYNQPGSLTTGETYDLTAYLLHANKLIASTQVINAKTLPGVVMPARKHFFIDDRKGGPEVK